MLDTAIVREGDKPFNCCLLIKGFCVRSKTTEQGKRQILSVHSRRLCPICKSLHLPVMDHEELRNSVGEHHRLRHRLAVRQLARSRPLIARPCGGRRCSTRCCFETGSSTSDADRRNNACFIFLSNFNSAWPLSDW